MNGWDYVVRPERALGVLLGLTGIARAAAWWIDRDEAKRAADLRRQQLENRYHRLPFGYVDEW